MAAYRAMRHLIAIWTSYQRKKKRVAPNCRSILNNILIRNTRKYNFIISSTHSEPGGGYCDRPTTFVMAKVRVVPLRFQNGSIPRLQLYAVQMGARLAKTIVKELRIEVAEQIFHSDLITFLKRMKSTK